MISVPPFPRLAFLRVRYTPLDVAAAAAQVTSREPSANFAYVVTPNAQHAVAAYRGDERFAGSQRGAWLVLNDSRILRLLAALLFGQRLPLAAGSDLVARLFEDGHMQGQTLTIIGGDTAMAALIRRRYAPAHVAQHIPPMGFYNSPGEIETCIRFVEAHPARYVFLVVGAPQSEMLAMVLARDRRTTGVGLCVGSALNFLTGSIRRAPPLLRVAHLEWLYRLAQNPARHARRVFIESAPILWIAVRERIAGEPDEMTARPGCAEATDARPTPLHGRVLDLAKRGAPKADACPRSAPTILVLALAAPLFCESFQYVVDCPPLYALTKAWPFLMLPVSVLAAATVRLAYKPLLLAAFAWSVGAAALVGVFQLGNSGIGAFAPTLKVWAILNGLSFVGVLAWLKPSPRQVERVIATLGAFTFAAMAIIWLVTPTSVYVGTIESTKVFLHDERGYRLNAPMMFGVLAIFLANRSFWSSPKLWKALSVAAAFALLVMIYKTRVLILGAAGVVVLGAALSAKRPPLALALLGAIFLVGAVPLWGYLHSDALSKSLGGSLSIRQIEFGKAVDFLNAAPWRWVTGVGSATRVGDVTLAEIVGTNFFFPSDLGWLGVTFEYGLIGAGLFLALHLFALKLGWKAVIASGLAGAAVFDYALFLILVSPVTSVALAPGEMASCLALGWWLSTGSGSEHLGPDHISRQRLDHDL